MKADRSRDPEAALAVRLAEDRHRRGDARGALRLYEAAIDRDPGSADAWQGAGAALKDLGEHAAACRALGRCLGIDGGRADCHHDLGWMRFELGDADGALRELRIAADLSDAPLSWLAQAMIVPGAPGADDREIQRVRTSAAERLRRDAPVPAGGRRPAPRRSDGRIRVGYLSSFFHKPNYMLPVWTLVNRHDRGVVEIHLISDSPAAAGRPGYRPRPEDHVHETEGLSNAELSDLIDDLALDILVDLNGYSRPERLPLLLHPRTATTVAWFNMYATSGLPGVRYLVGDGEVVREGEERRYTERVVRLPQSYLTFEAARRHPPVGPPPCVHRGAVTFGSLVTQYKVNCGVLDAWTAILRGAPESLLVLGNATLASEGDRDHLLGELESRGVDAERVRLRGPAVHAEFLRYYDEIDVALDAFPYNGGTTTIEAIWQGVPVLTFAGERWASRTSASLLARTHLGEFVTRDRAEMVQTGVALARDPGIASRLAGLRRSMRRKLRDSVACDGRGLAREMERVYRDIAGRRI
ncbi:MAG: hypothetical protein ACM3JH_05360 [Acidithiobacillales bacterium]